MELTRVDIKTNKEIRAVNNEHEPLQDKIEEEISRWHDTIIYREQCTRRPMLFHLVI